MWGSGGFPTSPCVSVDLFAFISQVVRWDVPYKGTEWGAQIMNIYELEMSKNYWSSKDCTIPQLAQG